MFSLSELMNIPPTNVWGLRLLSYLFSLLQPRSEDVVLDLGYGGGSAALLLANRAKQAVGIDISRETIQHLSKQQNPKNVEFRALDATKNPPAELVNRFDKCICLDMLEHVEDRSSVLTFIQKSLKPEGQFVISFPVEKPEHGCNPITHEEAYDISQKLAADSRVIFIGKNWFAKMVDQIYKLVRMMLGLGKKEADVFENTVCYSLLVKPKKIYQLYKLGITMLFWLTQNAYREHSQGRRAIICGHTQN